MVDINSLTADKLRYLADHIENMQHSKTLNPQRGFYRFNMAPYAKVNTKDNGEICGTVCCIAGEAVRLFKPSLFEKFAAQNRINYDAEAAKILDIEDEEADIIFYGDFSEKFNEKITPKEAAAALRELAEDYE